MTLPLEIDKTTHARAIAGSGTRLFDLRYLKIAIVTGKDANHFLQGQLSNDINHLSDEAPHQLSAYCTPKGRVLASFDVLKIEEGYALIAPVAVLNKALPRLRMFIMRAAVNIEFAETSDVFGLQLSSEHANADLSDLNNMGARSYQHNIDPRRFFVISNQNISDALRENRDGTELLSEKNWQSINIRQNLPEVFEQTIEAFIPQTINLDLVNGVNFKKGCYPGQEIIARVKYRGKPKTRMITAYVSNHEEIVVGSPVFIEGRESPAGMVSHLVKDAKTTLLSITVPVSHLHEGEVYLDQARSIKIERLACSYEITV